jgi:hypothetical protein
MPERHSPERSMSTEIPVTPFEVDTSAYFHRGNPDLRSLNEVRAAEAAKSFAESSRSQAEQELTGHGVARILTLYTIHMRRNELNQQDPTTTLN